MFLLRACSYLFFVYQSIFYHPNTKYPCLTNAKQYEIFSGTASNQILIMILILVIFNLKSKLIYKFCVSIERCSALHIPVQCTDDVFQVLHWLHDYMDCVFLKNKLHFWINRHSISSILKLCDLIVGKRYSNLTCFSLISIHVMVNLNNIDTCINAAWLNRF